VKPILSINSIYDESKKRVLVNFTAVFSRFSLIFSGRTPEKIKLVQSKNWIFEGFFHFQWKNLLAKIVTTFFWEKNCLTSFGTILNLINNWQFRSKHYLTTMLFEPFWDFDFIMAVGQSKIEILACFRHQHEIPDR
jgi:hypothetical protein